MASPLDAALAALRVRSVGMNAANGVGQPDPALAALAARSAGLNNLYGLPKTVKKRTPQVAGGATTTTAEGDVPSWWSGSPSNADIQSQADQQTDASLAAQAAPINSERARAAAAALADQKALSGLGLSVAELMKGIGPAIQQGYSGAAQDLAGMAAGFSGATADRVRQAQAQGAATIDQLAPGADHPQGTDPNALQDSLYGLGGFIPGGSLETQGAAANRWGSVLPAIEGVTTENEVAGRQAQQVKDDQKYAQDLIDLAGKRPDLRNQILDHLYQREVEALNARLGVRKQNQDERHTLVQEGLDARQVAVQEQALALYNKKYGSDLAYKSAELTLREAGLKLSQAKYQHQLDKDIAAGQQIDAAASRVKGTIVYKDGTVTNIPIAKTNSGTKSYQKAVGEARSLRGKPVTVTLTGTEINPHGKYVADPSQPYNVSGGVFPPSEGLPATTNDPSRAKIGSTYTFVEAQAYLMDKYGLTRAQARKALVSSGWKPDGKRPTK